MALADYVKAELKLTDLIVVSDTAEATKSLLGEYITAPAPPSSRPEAVAELIVIRPKGDRAWSFQASNLVRANPISPQGLAGLTVCTATYLEGAGHLIAFLTALTALAVRSVTRDEAMTLHLAHRLCLGR